MKEFYIRTKNINTVVKFVNPFVGEDDGDPKPDRPPNMLGKQINGGNKAIDSLISSARKNKKV